MTVDERGVGQHGFGQLLYPSWGLPCSGQLDAYTHSSHYRQRVHAPIWRSSDHPGFTLCWCLSRLDTWSLCYASLVSCPTAPQPWLDLIQPIAVLNKHGWSVGVATLCEPAARRWAVSKQRSHLLTMQFDMHLGSKDPFYHHFQTFRPLSTTVVLHSSPVSVTGWLCHKSTRQALRLQCSFTFDTRWT